MGLDHFWSLAVEEQFYLVWPLIVLLVPSRWLAPVFVAVCLGAGAARLVSDPFAAYISTLARMDALAAGGLLAVLPISGFLAGSIGLVLFALGASSDVAGARVWNEWAAIAMSLAVLDWVRTHGERRGLAARPLVYLGTISYGIYVYHNLIPTAGRMIEQRFGIWLRVLDVQPWRLLFMVTASIALAAVSWQLLERPINALKRFAPYMPVRREPRGQSEVLAAEQAS